MVRTNDVGTTSIESGTEGTRTSIRALCAWLHDGPGSYWLAICPLKLRSKKQTTIPTNSNTAEKRVRMRKVGVVSVNSPKICISTCRHYCE